jgi:hypothetical protein
MGLASSLRRRGRSPRGGVEWLIDVAAGERERCALGLNPVKSASWGAILGMFALAYFAIQVIHNG